MRKKIKDKQIPKNSFLLVMMSKEGDVTSEFIESNENNKPVRLLLP